MNRKVKVFKAGALDPETRSPARELDYIGDFHQFVSGVVFPEFQIEQTAAIVEKPSGEVRIVLLQNLQFVKEPISHKPPGWENQA